MFCNLAFGREAIDEASKKEIITVLEAQEDLHAAYFEYDQKSVLSAANKVEGALKKISKKKGEFKDALSGIKEISKTKDEESNKEAYFKFSAALASIVKKYDLGKNYNVYYCPMVKKSWIQDSSKHDGVRNPYASYMPECGRKETDY